jgi:hypothetical protein
MSVYAAVQLSLLLLLSLGAIYGLAGRIREKWELWLYLASMFGVLVALAVLIIAKR